MAKKFDNISNNNVRIGANGLNGLFSSTAVVKEEAPSVETPVSSPAANPAANTTRQTFVILAEDLQFIKNVVRTKRMEGDIEFTQKEALHHIIDFYRTNHT